MTEFINHEHGFTDTNLIRCPLHGAVHRIHEYCPQCFGEIKRGDLSGRPRVPHYQQGGIEPIDYIRANNLNHLEGCIIKYVTRYPFKGNPIGDLEKARDYLNWLIEEVQSVTPPPCRCLKCNHRKTLATDSQSHASATRAKEPGSDD